MWYMVVEGIWGYEMGWFPEGTNISTLSDGICFYKSKA